MDKDHFSRYRLQALALIEAVTLAGTLLICLIKHFYSDAWFCVFFLTLIFLLVFIFQIEYDRTHLHLDENSESSLRFLSLGYCMCIVLMVLFSFFPPFFKPVILIPIIMNAFANEGIAISVGLYACSMLGLSDSGNYYETISYVMLVLIGSILCKTLHEKKYRLYTSFLFFCLPLMITCIFYYWNFLEVKFTVYLYGIICGIFTASFVYFLYEPLCKERVKIIEKQHINIIADNYSRVQEIRAYSPSEYQHARWVSNLAGACAKQIGLDSFLCASAGFYYHMGKWVGEPHVENGVIRAKQLCFPKELQQILTEFNGEEKLPSTKESALVHMIDAIILKVEILHDEIATSKWNRDMVIYQTLNELSFSGLYDKSHISINEYIKIRDYLAKEVF